MSADSTGLERFQGLCSRIRAVQAKLWACLEPASWDRPRLADLPTPIGALEATYNELDRAVDELLRHAETALLADARSAADGSEGVPMADYLGDIVNAAWRAHGWPGLAAEVDAAGVALEPERALVCGLLVAELVGQACSHRFPGDRSGWITVRLQRAAGHYRLSVSHTGVEPRPALDRHAVPSLGMRMVSTACRMLGGRIQKDTTTGTTVIFPLEPGRPPVRR